MLLTKTMAMAMAMKYCFLTDRTMGLVATPMRLPPHQVSTPVPSTMTSQSGLLPRMALPAAVAAAAQSVAGLPPPQVTVSLGSFHKSAPITAVLA